VLSNALATLGGTIVPPKSPSISRRVTVSCMTYVHRQAAFHAGWWNERKL
jgi:hypothetical protein